VVVIDEVNHGRQQPQKFPSLIKDTIKVEAVA